MKDKLINCLVAGVSLAIALVAVEVGLRLFPPSSMPLAVPDAKLGVIYRPHVTQSSYNFESNTKITISTNSNGFRDSEWDSSWANTVMVLGDSFVAGMEVPKEQRFTELLESSLSSATSTPWHVLNFGVSGTGPEAYIEKLRAYGSVFMSEYVVVSIFNGNDLENLNYDLNPAAGRINYIVKDDAVVAYRDIAPLREKIEWGVKLFLGQSYLVQLAHDAWVKFLNRGSADQTEEATAQELPGYCNIPAPELSNSLKILTALLKEMNVLSQGHLVIVDIPDKAQLSDTLPAGCDPMLIENYLTAFSKNENIPLVNVYDSFAGHDENEFYYSGHLNEKGHEEVSKLLLKEIFAK